MVLINSCTHTCGNLYLDITPWLNIISTVRNHSFTRHTSPEILSILLKLWHLWLLYCLYMGNNKVWENFCKAVIWCFYADLLGRKPDSCNILWGSKHSQAGSYSGEYIALCVLDIIGLQFRKRAKSKLLRDNHSQKHHINSWLRLSLLTAWHLECIL